MKIFFSTLTLVIFALNSAKAQHDHSSHNNDDAEHTHKTDAPHGGELKDIGKYHLEIVFDAYSKNEKFNIWILKSNFKLLEPKEYIATMKLTYIDGKEIEKELTVGTDKLFCNVEDVSKAFTAVVVVNVKGKEYHIIYNYKGFGK